MRSAIVRILPILAFTMVSALEVRAQETDVLRAVLDRILEMQSEYESTNAVSIGQASAERLGQCDEDALGAADAR